MKTKSYYYCIYRGKFGPQTSFLVPLSEKESYREKILDFVEEILFEFEIEIPE